MKHAVEADILCKFEVRDSGGDVFRQCTFLTSPSAQSGTHKPEQVFVSLVPVDWDMDCEGSYLGAAHAGMILEFQTLAFVDPPASCHFPIQPEMSGRLRMWTSDQFAAYLLDLPIQANSNRDPVEVKAYLMEFLDILPSRVMLTGKIDNIPNLLANPNISPLSNPDREESDQDSDDAGGPAQDEDGMGQGNAECDLLLLLEQSDNNDSKPKRKKTKPSDKSTKESTESSSKGYGDVILDDPCLRTFLSPDDIMALQVAREHCVTMNVDVNDWSSDLRGDFGESDGDEDEIELVEPIDEQSNCQGGDADTIHSAASSSKSSSEPLSYQKEQCSF